MSDDRGRRIYDELSAVDAKSMRDVGMTSGRPTYDEAAERLAAVWPPVTEPPADDAAPPVAWPEFPEPARRKEAS